MAATPGPGRAWARRLPLAAGLLGFVTFLPSLRGGFLYDDQHVILDNRLIRDLSQPALWLRAEPSRPLLGLSWALNHAAGGYDPLGYHLGNVLLHGASAALAASVLLVLSRARAGPAPEAAALVSAAWFAVTPMAVETVAYVSSRSSLLAAAFGLAALRVGIAALTGRSIRLLLGAVALLSLGLAAKEEAASVPLALVLVDYFYLARGNLSDLRQRVRWHLPLLALPVLGLIARRLATGDWLPPPALDHGRYLATQAALFPQYLLRALVAFDPAFFRHHEAAGWPPQPWLLLGLGASLAIACAAWRLRRRMPDLAFAVAFMAACLLPSSSLVPLKEVLVDHRAYLGGLGVAHLVGAWWRAPLTPFAVAVLGLMAGRSVQYQGLLADPVTAWEDAVRRAPGSAEARRGLAEAQLARRDTRAEEGLLAALALDPRDVRSWSNLGALYLETDRPERAVDALKRASALAPHDARVSDNLGMALLRLGDEAGALAAFEAAVGGRPALAQPRLNLAALLVARGERERALALVEEARHLEIDEQDAERIEALRARLR